MLVDVSAAAEGGVGVRRGLVRVSRAAGGGTKACADAVGTVAAGAVGGGVGGGNRLS